MARALVAVLGLAACGRLGFDGVPLAADAGSADAPGTDARGDCWAAWATGAPALDPPQLLAGPSTPDADEQDPSPSADGLTLYFGRATMLGADVDSKLYRATRASPADDFGSGVMVAELGGDVAEKIAFEGDASHAILAAAISGGAGNEDLYETVLSGSGFATPDESQLAAVNDGQHQLDPWVSADGSDVYFAILDLSAGSQALAMTARATPGGPFGAPTPVAVSGSLANTADPSLSPDERTLVFSERATTSGSAHVALATRPAIADGFVEVSALPALNTGSSEERDAAFSGDGCTVYFSSTRAGTRDLYAATVRP